MSGAENYEGRTDPVAMAAAAYRDRVAIMQRAGMHVDAAAVTQTANDPILHRTKETQ